MKKEKKMRFTSREGLHFFFCSVAAALQPVECQNKRPGGVLSTKAMKWTCSPQTERRQGTECAHTQTHTHTRPLLHNSYTCLHKYSRGEEEGDQPESLLPEDAARPLKPVITHRHTAKNPKISFHPLHYTFPKPIDKTLSKNINQFFPNYCILCVLHLCKNCS